MCVNVTLVPRRTAFKSINGFADFVCGTLCLFMQDQKIRLPNRRVRAEGVVEYRGKTPEFLRAFFVESLDEQ